METFVVALLAIIAAELAVVIYKLSDINGDTRWILRWIERYMRVGDNSPV